MGLFISYCSCLVIDRVFIRELATGWCWLQFDVGGRYA